MSLTDRRALPLEDARTLWQTAVDDDTARAPIAQLLLAGLRPAEVAGARWDGQTCPDGYSLQPLQHHPDVLVCRRDEPPPEDEPGPPRPTAAALDPTRRTYP